MSGNNDSINCNSAIASAVADFGRILAQDVVIGGETAGRATGAQRREPSHSPRATLAGQPAFERALPKTETVAAPDLHRAVEQLGLAVEELFDLALQVGAGARRDEAGSRQLERGRRCGAERRAWRVVGLDRLGAGAPCLGAGLDHDLLCKQVLEVGSGARNRSPASAACGGRTSE